jgi:hypothetical protein
MPRRRAMPDYKPMTEGERLVWAAAFAYATANPSPGWTAVQRAYESVSILRTEKLMAEDREEIKDHGAFYVAPGTVPYRWMCEMTGESVQEDSDA